MQLLQSLVVLDELQGGGHELCGGVGITHEDGGVFVDERQGVMGLMVLGDVGRRHQNGGLTQQTEFTSGISLRKSRHSMFFGLPAASHVALHFS